LDRMVDLENRMVNLDHDVTLSTSSRTVLVDSAPAALLAPRAPTTVLADFRPTALLTVRALLSVWTSAAHPAFRPILHPVLARPLRARGSLPLRALLRHLLSPTVRVLDFAILVEGHSHVRPPNRRQHIRLGCPTAPLVDMASRHPTPASRIDISPILETKK